MAEDFTTYTEVDTGGYLTVTSSKVAAANVVATTDAYVYKDYGADNFDALDLDYEFQVTSSSTGSNQYIILGISNTVDDWSGWGAGFYSGGVLNSGANSELAVLAVIGGTSDTSTDISTSTVYYCTITRSAGGDAITTDVYTDSGRTSLLVTLSASGLSTTKFRYSYGFSAYGGGGDRIATGFTQNMTFNAAAGATHQRSPSGGVAYGAPMMY